MVSTSFSQINFGIKVGFQPTTTSTNTDSEPKWRPSYLGGIYGNLLLSKKFSLTTELIYADKGQKVNFSEFNNPDIFYHRTYLNIPLLLQYSINPKLALHAGGEAGFLLASYAKRFDNKFNTKSYFGNSLDIGIAAGASYKIDSRFNIVLRYTYGLSNVIGKNAYVYYNSNIFDISVDARTAGQKYYNRTIQLSLNYSIRKLKSFKAKDDTLKPRISFGLKGGINLNSVLREKYFAFDYETGMATLGEHLGMYMSIALSDKMSVIPEIQFIKKGYALMSPGYNGQNAARSTIGLYYIELPIILSYAVSKFVSIDAGPVFGERVLTTEKINYPIEPRKDFYNTNNSEFGFTAGLCFNVYERLSAGCRYYRGMTNISNIYDKYYTSEYNQNFQISTYYRLGKNNY
jgi:hypothetical protein